MNILLSSRWRVASARSGVVLLAHARIEDDCCDWQVVRDAGAYGEKQIGWAGDRVEV